MFGVCELVSYELSGPIHGRGCFGHVEPNCKQLFKSFVTKSPSSIWNSCYICPILIDGATGVTCCAALQCATSHCPLYSIVSISCHDPHCDLTSWIRILLSLVWLQACSINSLDNLQSNCLLTLELGRCRWVTWQRDRDEMASDSTPGVHSLQANGREFVMWQAGHVRRCGVTATARPV